MEKFIKGKKLSEAFFHEVVKPLLKKYYPQLKYSAALIGPGSEVIDFDTPRSMDHDWGPRVILFLGKKDVKNKKRINHLFSRKLPYTFREFATNFGQPGEDGSSVSEKITTGKIQHKIAVTTIEKFFKEYLNINITDKITIYDWLVFPEHKLLTVTSGKVFHDDLALKKTINKFSYYPKDIWLYLLASQWTRIAQEEHFMGRCGELNDEIGSRIIATRLVKAIIEMCFLMEQQYTPYIKWLGSGFNNLKSTTKLKPLLSKTIQAGNWQAREKQLVKAYEILARMHNKLKITKPLKTKVEYFHNRPFLVINGDVFASEIKKKIKNPTIKIIKSAIGSINQFSDSTDVLEGNTQKFKSVYK